MEGAENLVAIVEAFVNAIKTVFNALKELFGSIGGAAEETE